MKKAVLYSLGAIIVGALLGVGFFYATKAPEPKFSADPTPNVVTPTPIDIGTSSASLSATRSASPSASVKTGPSPLQVTQSYYSAYQNCLKNPPAAAAGNVSVYCQQNNQFVSADFSKNMAGRGAGVDPVLCSQNPPSSVTIDRQSITGGTASTYAITSGDAQRQILVHLSNDTGTWKVSDIICPRI